MEWIEVSLLVDGEMAEAVAEVMARYVSGGVVISSTAIEADPEDVGRVVGPLKVAAYFPSDENLETTRQKLEEGLYYLGRIHQPLPPPTFTTIKETNWVEAWKEHYHPIPIGQRLIILPSWYQNPDPARIPIIIEPGMAFGTGTHPTTQLCLELLETHFHSTVEAHPTVLDIGCGSGILTIAARKLGATTLVGVDIDPEALDNAQKNADLNEVLGQIEWGVGSVREILGGQFPVEKAHLLLANILAPVIIRLLDHGMADLLYENGEMILSGILAEQEGDVITALERHQMGVTGRRQIGDWVGLVAKFTYR
ncbi:MAG: 50S ribosomal protein L11 methyltransferase [Anaerolineales bacterium]|nr:50S ribosomal protein L11 methyltransferase [Anaerolineales bacterium]